MSDFILEARSLHKTFESLRSRIPILEGVDLQIRPGEKVAIVGPSGSGKSTLLSLLGLLDSPTEGTIYINNEDTSVLDEEALAKKRNRDIGFIFQSFELIAPFTVSENVAAPLEIAGERVDPDKVKSILDELGLGRRRFAMPATLSGGEKQRVAIARALIHDPALILADEPTGSLDRETGEKVLSLLLDAVSNRSSTLVIITHDETVAKRMDRVLYIEDKKIHERV